MSQSETRSRASDGPGELPFFGSESPPALPPDGVTPRVGSLGEEPTAPHTPLPRPLPDIPGYEILREIDRGGMGIVYEARVPRLKRTVALKLVPPFGRDADAVRRRFEREVGLLGGLDHPNILRVEHADEWAGCHYFTMRYVPGGTLGQHLPRIRADLRAAVGLVAKVARAVGVLHAAGVLHRDLKPSNILLGDGDEPLVADFGLAKSHDDTDSLTPDGAPVGTRLYMSPEQTRGAADEYAPSCDIWALGVILYEVLTGRRPFDDRNVVELYRRIQSEPAEACSSANPDVPAALDRVVQRCLAKRPAERYPTADAIADDLERWLAGEDVPPLPPPPKPRRRWVSAATVVGLAAVLAAGFLIPDRARPAGPDPPAPATLTVADRLRAGEEVELIGPTGMPLVPTVPLAGSTERFSPDRDGYATLSSGEYGGVELSSEPLPLPVRVDGELAIAHQHGGVPYAALYAGRREWPGADRQHTTFVLLKLWETPIIRPDAVHVRVRVVAAPAWWDGSRHPYVLHARELADARQQPLDNPQAPPPPLVWQSFSLTVDATEVRPAWGGRHLRPVGDEYLRHVTDHGHRQLRLAPPPPDRPLLGGGVGLFVHRCSATFRNVRLVPLARPL